LAGHQVGDGGFEVGFADVGFRECRAKFPVIIDDDINQASGLVVRKSEIDHREFGTLPPHQREVIVARRNRPAAGTAGLGKGAPPAVELKIAPPERGIIRLGYQAALAC